MTLTVNFDYTRGDGISNEAFVFGFGGFTGHG